MKVPNLSRVKAGFSFCSVAQNFVHLNSFVVVRAFCMYFQQLEIWVGHVSISSVFALSVIFSFFPLYFCLSCLILALLSLLWDMTENDPQGLTCHYTRTQRSKKIHHTCNCINASPAEPGDVLPLQTV